MKKILTLFGLLALSTISYSQFEPTPTSTSTTIGEIALAGIIEKRLKFKVVENDTMYFLMYRNLKFQHLTEYEGLAFFGDTNTVSALYRILKSVFLPENIEKLKRDFQEVNIVNFKLGSDEVSIFLSSDGQELNGTVYAPRGFFKYNEKELDILFGKNNNSKG